MKNLLKDALILFIITLVVCVFLCFVYEITKDARAEQAEIKKNNAYKAVFEDYEGFNDVDFSNVTFDELDISSITNLDDKLSEAGYEKNVAIINGVAHKVKKGTHTF